MLQVHDPDLAHCGRATQANVAGLHLHAAGGDARQFNLGAGLNGGATAIDHKQRVTHKEGMQVGTQAQIHLVCQSRADFGQSRRIFDVGGNRRAIDIDHPAIAIHRCAGQGEQTHADALVAVTGATCGLHRPLGAGSTEQHIGAGFNLLQADTAWDTVAGRSRIKGRLQTGRYLGPGVPGTHRIGQVKDLGLGCGQRQLPLFTGNQGAAKGVARHACWRSQAGDVGTGNRPDLHRQRIQTQIAMAVHQDQAAAFGAGRHISIARGFDGGSNACGNLAQAVNRDRQVVWLTGGTCQRLTLGVGPGQVQGPHLALQRRRADRQTQSLVA